MHQCPACPKSFPSHSKLQRHHIIHTGQKPFACIVCGKAFTQSAHLKTHLLQVHRPRPPGDRLRQGESIDTQQPSCDAPAAGSYTHGKSSYNTAPRTVSTSPVSRWKREAASDTFVLPSSETGNLSKITAHVGEASVAQRSFPNVLGPVPQEQAASAGVDTSVSSAHRGHTCKVCLKSFSSSLQLWIHSATHNKPNKSERGSWQTFSTEAVVNSGSQELTTKKSQTTLNHQCPKCLKTFCSPSKLQRHFLIHTGYKPYSCTICWKAFTQKVHLKSHLRASNTCSPSAGQKQRLCNGTQTSDLLPQSSLQQPAVHLPPVNSSVELELQCKISVNAVQNLSETEIKSEAVVKPEQPSNSSICYKLEEQEQQYVPPKGSKPFQCEICGRSFRLEVNLIRHHKIHRSQTDSGSPTPVPNGNNVSNSEAITHVPEPSNADPIALNSIVKPETWSEMCSDYSGSLPLDTDLTTAAEQQREACQDTSKQKRINTLRQCPMCSKCFPSASKLHRHVMIHTGQRPFGCDVCGKTFRQKTHLTVHCRTHTLAKYHKQRSLYINRPPSRIGGFYQRAAADLPVQGALVQRKDSRRCDDVVPVKHLDQIAPLISERTNAGRKPENYLLQHASRKNGVVLMSKVSKVTVKRKQTAKSAQNPGNVQHRCFQCLKCFQSASKLQRHELVHTGLRPFCCLTCGKAFRQAPHLKTHERSHCKRKPCKPLYHQGNIRKLKAKRQQQLYPRITVRIPSQKKSARRDFTLSNSDVVCNGVNALPSVRREIPFTPANSLFNTNAQSGVPFRNRKLHMCRICSKSFGSPYKLSRHLVTHSGIRPYKCTVCCKTFTQKGHLKLHEHRCGRGNEMSDHIQSDVINTDRLQDKCLENLTDCTDYGVNATREQRETQYAGVGHYSFTDKDLAHCSEAIDSEWLAVAEVDLKEENDESDIRDNGDQAADHYNYSFSSELAFEINKLVQNENMAAPLLSHQHEGTPHDVEMPFQGRGPASDCSRFLSDGFVSSVVDHQMQPDNYWCEPLAVFECDMCTTSFKSEGDLKRHACSANVQLNLTEPAQRNHCGICFKYFVSPSKLKRHYVIHTGQRPFRCDICGKAFTQAAHVRTHQLTH